jgi:kexin
MARAGGISCGLVVVAVLMLGLPGCGGGDSTPVTTPTPVVPVASGEDPLYSDQWHLHNNGQSAGLLAGEDINVEPVWSSGVKGSGVLLAVVDDGLEIGHEDLVANVAADKSWDYEQGDSDPTPPPSSTHSHGTKVAGIAAARDLNAVGGRGAAPRVSLAGYNLLFDDTGTLTTDMGNAMMRDVNVAISSNSWGLGEDGAGVAEHPLDSFWHDGIANGIANGRGGRGAVYVWAGGNGGMGDNSNYDYLANNRHVMAICAVDGDGVRAPYSEPGANLWLCAPGGYYNWLTTTDLTGERGDNYSGVSGDYDDHNYTKRFAGTSAATPIVSGVVALMLEAKPELGWRDVRLILAETARKSDVGDSDWKVTVPASSGQPQYHINHKYGFGVVDAYAAVTKAKGWTNVGPQVVSTFPVSSPLDIPDYPLAGIEQSVTVAAANELIIEYVEIEVYIVHGDVGELKITLIAPSGTQSVLAEAHDCVCGPNDYNPWTFGSSRHLGESSKGVWKLKVEDQTLNNTGALISWTLRIYGRQS